MKDTTLILASSSPRRRELVRLLGHPVEIMPSEADESVEADWTPAEIVERLSLRKAAAVRKRLAPGGRGIVIGSDTIVVLDGRVLGKPRDEAEAAETLSSLQGRAHEVYSGLALIDAASGESFEGTESGGVYERHGDIAQYRVTAKSAKGRPATVVGHTVSKVIFRPMSGEEIRAYVRTGDPLDKAGSYGIQGVGSVFIEKIEGDFYSIMGLPLHLLDRMLIEYGVRTFRE